MAVHKKILAIGNHEEDFYLLKKDLSPEYDIVRAKNTQQGLDIFAKHDDALAAIVLDFGTAMADEYAFLQTVRAENSTLPLLVLAKNKDAELTALTLGATDFIGKPYQAAIVHQRLKNLLLLHEKAALRNTTEHDNLTHLYNKETFFAKARSLLDAHTEQQYALVCIDIEHFKLVNDLYGVAQGDAVLCHVAKEIRQQLKTFQGIAARLRSDLFALCLPLRPFLKEDLTQFATATLKEYPLDMKLVLKIGIYPIEDSSLPIDVMCDRAQMAISLIKGKFNQPCASYNDSLRRILLEEQEILNSMHESLSKKQISVYFQPKVDLYSLKIIGAEALARWHHPVMGAISPGRFIPIFEKNGFISTMDEFIWEETCRLIRLWLDAGLPVVPVSMNVSRVDTYNPNLCNILNALVKKYSIPYELLNLEVTESAYVEHPEQVIAAVSALRTLGFRVEMDDFGSGYSSLNMLKDIPVDILKIDLRFLRGAEETERGLRILASVVRMAKWIALPVIAEGVEKKEEVDFLRSIGCNSAQGFFFAHPMPEQEFRQYLRNKAAPQERYESVLDVPRTFLWSDKEESCFIFNMLPSAAALIEYDGNHVELLRVNKTMIEQIHIHGFPSTEWSNFIEKYIQKAYWGAVHAALHTAAEKRCTEKVCCHLCAKAKTMWVRLNFFCISQEINKTLFTMTVENLE